MNKPRKPKEKITIKFSDGSKIVQYHKIVHTYKTVDGNNKTYGNLKDGRSILKTRNGWIMEVG